MGQPNANGAKSPPVSYTEPVLCGSPRALGASRFLFVWGGFTVCTLSRTSTLSAISRGPCSRPESHRAVVERSHERLIEQAGEIGPFTRQIVAGQTRMKRHPEEVLRSAQGILRPARDFSPEALERAVERALTLQGFSYRALKASHRSERTSGARIRRSGTRARARAWPDLLQLNRTELLERCSPSL
jgi:hypothetical protein